VKPWVRTWRRSKKKVLCREISIQFIMREYCHVFRVCVTNNNGFWIGWLDLLAILLQLQPVITAHNQWLLTTSSIPYWTTSVFSFTVNEWRTKNICSLNYWTPLRVESDVTTDGPSASLSWNKAPVWGLRSDFYYCQTVAGLLIWGALSEERTGLSFTIAAGLRQRSHFRVRVPWNSWPHFYCLRSETSLFVASYDSQGYGGMNYDSLIIPRWPEYRSPLRTVRVILFFPLPWELTYWNVA
jgi:hypothetical protein